MSVQHRLFNEYSRQAAITVLTDLEIETGEKEWYMTIRKYSRDRSLEMNALSHVWYAQLAAKVKEDTAAGYKGFCKLHFGVPILREDPEFSELYDRVFKPMSYPTKIEIMTKPGLFDVTSLMKVDQMTLYMEHIQAHFADKIELRWPNEPPGYR